MRYQLVFQDPSSDDPAYLYEGIIRELEAADVVRFEGVFAFASQQGVASLLEDPDFIRFLSRGGSCSLIVGLDAITNERTLDLLELLSGRHRELEVAVFHNDIADLFHPKVSRFIREDGGATVLAGSGNLTPGGLRRNIEAYSIVDLRPDEIGTSADLGSWDDFVLRHKARIRPIDDDARRVARANRVVRRKRLHDVEPEAEETEAATSAEEASVDEAADESGLHDDQRMLLSPVPRGQGRWNQVHFNIEATRDFLRAAPNSHERVSLYEVLPDGSLGEVEVRKVVYSLRNRNRKIELRAHHGEAYPAAGPPLLVIREVATRVHRYQMLFPDDLGYSELNALRESRPSIGRGLHRAIVTAADVLEAWPTCPV